MSIGTPLASARLSAVSNSKLVSPRFSPTISYKLDGGVRLKTDRQPGAKSTTTTRHLKTIAFCSATSTLMPAMVLYSRTKSLA